ncbi:MAG: hypothetical protein OEY03_01410 [Rhizobacter sp.]|nr:hypothetical protein [Rhizobacter sp.]
MSIDRRKIIGLFAASAATALAGCGGGGDAYIPPARFMWLLNLNPEFPSLDISFGATPVSSTLPFPALTPRFEVEHGSYSVALRQRSSGLTQLFDGVVVNANSPSVLVFYRHFASTRLGSAFPGIINLFDSNVSLDVDLFDDVGNVQPQTLAFEGSAPQSSRSRNCTLRLYAAGSPDLIYDSGLQQRTDSILVFPRYPAASPLSGQVAVVGLNHDFGSSAAVSWPNTLG